MERRWTWIALAMIVALLALSFLQRQVAAPDAREVVSYSAFKAILAEGRVAKVIMRGDDVDLELDQAVQVAPGRTSARLATRLPPTGDPDLLPALERLGVEITALPPPAGDGWLAGWLPWLLLIGFYAFLWSRMSRNIAGGVGTGTFARFLKGRATEQDQSARTVRFVDVAGQDNAKAEIAELIDFLRDPQRYRRLGAEPPRGVLLMGPPGTGKTLLARPWPARPACRSSTSRRPSSSRCLSASAPAGCGRCSTRRKSGRRRSSFIDELDAVGRVRGTGIGGGHDEREQTLNQILLEMDGFEGHEAVIVLAATNRPDVLDPALLRPGRFDRHVTLDLPDRAAREAILAVHVRSKPLADEVDLGVIAAGTPGFSVADLKNLVNEAAIASARENGAAIGMRHLDAARDRVLMGMERKLAIGQAEKHRLAVHEAGHATVARLLPHADPLYKVTIIPRGRSPGGTHLLPKRERYTQCGDELADRLAVMLAGRAAERTFLGDVSSGADDDIRQASQLARAMVGRWGISDKIGPVDLRQSEEHPFLGREIAQPRTFSDDTAHEVDEEVRRLLLEAEGRAAEIIERHRDAVSRLVAALEQQETLDREAVDLLLNDAATAAPRMAAE